jgi:hypothetical protein
MENTKKNRRKKLVPTATDPLRSLGKIASIASFGLFVIVLVKYVDGRYHCDFESSAQDSLVAQNWNRIECKLS